MRNLIRVRVRVRARRPDDSPTQFDDFPSFGDSPT